VQRNANHVVDLVKSFLTSIFYLLAKSASIQPKSSHFIFIILVAFRDLIFTKRSSPLPSCERHVVYRRRPHQCDGLSMHALRTKADKNNM